MDRNYTEKRFVAAPSSRISLLIDSTAKHLEPLKGGKLPLEILVRGKDAEQNSKQLEQCLEVIKSAGVRGILFLAVLVR